MFHFSPLFGFIFPEWFFTTGGGREKWDATKRRVEKGKKRETIRIHKNSEHLTSQNTPDDYLRNVLSSIICLYVKKKSQICTFSNVSLILPYLSSPHLMFWFRLLFNF